MSEDEKRAGPLLDPEEPRWAPEVELFFSEEEVADGLVETDGSLEALVAREMLDPDGLAHQGAHSELDLVVAFELGRRRAVRDDGIRTLMIGVLSGAAATSAVFWFLSALGAG